MVGDEKERKPYWTNEILNSGTHWGLGLTLTNVKVAYSVGKKLSQGIIFYAL